FQIRRTLSSSLFPYTTLFRSEFILCLGYGAAAVKDYFLHYDETRSNDFVLENGGRDVTLMSKDISDWRITFVDTGLNSPIGERLDRKSTRLNSSHDQISYAVF